MGITTAELTQKLKDGALDSKEFLGNFSVYLKNSTDEKFKKILGSYAFSLKRLNVAREEFIRGIADNGGEEVFQQLTEFAIYLLQILKPVTAALAAAFKWFSRIFFGPLGRAIKRVSDVIGDMAENAGEGSKELRKIKSELASMIVVMTPIIFMFRKFFLGLLVFELMVAIWDDLNMYIKDGKGLLGEFMDKMDDPKWREEHPIIDTFMTAYVLLGELIDSVDKLFKNQEFLDNPLVRAFTDIEETINTIIELLTKTLPAAWSYFKGSLGYGTDEEVADAQKTNEEKSTPEYRDRIKAQATKRKVGGINNSSLLPSKETLIKGILGDNKLGNWAVNTLSGETQTNKNVTDINMYVKVEGASQMDKTTANQIAKEVSGRVTNQAALAGVPQ
jgi:hypothetical protein